jgi:selenocysteine-specific elongation factor
LHVGTASVLARVAMLEKTEMLPGEKQMVQLRMAEPLLLAPGERFVLRANIGAEGRDGLATIGGGRILGTSNTRLRRQKQWTLDALSARAAALGDPRRWCELVVRESASPIKVDEVQARAFLRQDEVLALISALKADGVLVEFKDGTLAHRDHLKALAERMGRALEAFHAANPSRAGMSCDEIFANSGASPEPGQAALQLLLQGKRVERSGAVYSRTGWRAQVSDPEQVLAGQVAAAFQKAGFAGPSVAELALSLKQPAEKIQRALRLLGDRGELVRLPEEMLLHRESFESAKQVVVRLFANKTSFSTMDFRDALGVSRKYAVPILDHLDKLRFTVRCGNNRTPGVEARKLMAR